MLPPEAPTTDQVTFWLLLLLTEALKTRESPVCITLDAPVMLTTTAGSGGGGSGVDPPPPQPASMAPARYDNPMRPLQAAKVGNNLGCLVMESAPRNLSAEIG